MSIRPDPSPAAPPRVRAAEGIGPRPSELLADRLDAAAALAKLTASRAGLDGDPARERVDFAALAELASVQRGDEDELLARWHHFRGYYVAYLDVVRAREATLKGALDALATITGERAGDPKVRSALRLCRLRRPPLAKVEALVSEANGLSQAPSATSARRRLR